MLCCFSSLFPLFVLLCKTGSTAHIVFHKYGNLCYATRSFVLIPAPFSPSISLFPRCHVNLPSIVKVVDDGAGFAGRSSLWLPAARLCEQVRKRLDCWVTTCDADDDDVIKTEHAPAHARVHQSTHPSTHTSASMAEVVMATNFERILMVVQTPVVRG